MTCGVDFPGCPAPSLIKTRGLAAGLPNLRFEEADARSLSYEDESFEAVVFRTCLHYPLQNCVEARKRLHHNVLAIALANKLARIAWAVLNKERTFECIRTAEMASRPA